MPAAHQMRSAPRSPGSTSPPASAKSGPPAAEDRVAAVAGPRPVAAAVGDDAVHAPQARMRSLPEPRMTMSSPGWAPKMSGGSDGAITWPTAWTMPLGPRRSGRTIGAPGRSGSWPWRSPPARATEAPQGLQRGQRQDLARLKLGRQHVPVEDVAQEVRGVVALHQERGHVQDVVKRGALALAGEAE